MWILSLAVGFALTFGQIEKFFFFLFFNKTPSFFVVLILYHGDRFVSSSQEGKKDLMTQYSRFSPTVKRRNRSKKMRGKKKEGRKRKQDYDWLHINESNSLESLRE